MLTTQPKIRTRQHPHAPWSEWRYAKDIEEFDKVLFDEYDWGPLRHSEHQKETKCPI